MLGHSAFLYQPLDILAVDLAPQASRATRGVALKVAFLVEGLPNGVDPAPAERGVDGFAGRDRFQSRCDLVDLDPDLVFDLMVLAEPGIECVCILEFMDFARIDFHCGHGLSSNSPAIGCRHLPEGQNADGEPMAGSGLAALGW